MERAQTIKQVDYPEDEDGARLAACLDYVRAEARGEVEGLFGPGSMTWLLFREPTILLGGLRAILLQVAHPAVASGVGQNSRFRDDLLGRARRTYTAMYQLLFGDLATALGAAQRLHRMHDRVRGSAEPGSNSPWAGQQYRANDPALLLWVHATLVDGALRLFEQLHRPLSAEEKRRFYDDSRLGAALLGVPPALYPPTLADFDRYMADTLTGATLALGEASRVQARVLLTSPYTPGWLATLTAGLMPARWRDGYALPWGQADERRYRHVVATLRLGVRLCPPTLRAVPAWHQARLRVAQAQGQPGPRLARGVAAVAARVELPLSLRPLPAKRAEPRATSGRFPARLDK